MNYWKNRSVFVTGATGLLGGWLVQELLAKEANVVALVRDFVPHSRFYREQFHQQVTIIHGDLSSKELLCRTISEYEVTTVFHLAAQTIVGVAKNDPFGTLEANIRGSWNLLEAVRTSGRQVNVIFASSDKAYGNSSQLPYLETHPMAGEYPYDVSKSCADLIAQMYAKTYGVSVAVTRCGNLFGGGDLNFNRTIPGLIQATLQGMPFEIRSDGQYVRDFLYIEDAVAGYLKLAEQLANNPNLAGEAFNFSLGLKLTVLDIVNKVLNLMECTQLQPKILNIATAEIREQYMVADKAEQLLSWQPIYNLEQGLLLTIAWYRSFFESQTTR